jgi:hypothetical protein
LLASILLIPALLFCHVRTVGAQLRDSITSSDQQLTAPITSAFGFRLGAAYFNDGEAKFVTHAYYQIPIGAVLLSPGLVLMTGGNGLSAYSEFNSSFGLELWFIFPGQRKKKLGGNESFGSFGGEFMIWGDRASAGVPIAYSYDLGISNSTSLELTAMITPLIFLGGEGTRVYFSILAGLRFPGQDEY